MRHRASLEEIVAYTTSYSLDNPLPSVTPNITEGKDNLAYLADVVHNSAMRQRCSTNLGSIDFSEDTKENKVMRILAHHAGSISVGGNLLVSYNTYAREGYSKYTVKIWKEDHLYGLELLGRGYRVSSYTSIKKWDCSKLTRLLSRIGMEEKYVTELATKLGNKPKEYVIETTNMYIPEHYLHLREAQSLTSCMAKNSHIYDLEGEGPNCTDLHPTMVYENSSNVRLGLLREVGSDKPYPYVARFVLCINPNGKVSASRVYGLERSEGLIKAAGVEISDIEGGRLQKIDARGSYLMPYLDGSVNGVSDEGGYYTVDSDGEYCAESECGLLEDPTVECEHCGDYYNPEDMGTMFVRGSELRCCEGCRSDAIYVESRDEVHHREDVVQLCSEYYGCSWSTQYELEEDSTHVEEGWIREEDCVELGGECIHYERRDEILQEIEDEKEAEAERKAEDEAEERRMRGEAA